MKHIVSFLFLLFLLSACANADKEAAGTLTADALFYDYQIWGEEGRDDVTVRLQYRLNGEAGIAVILPEPAAVSLDGSPLPADSAKLTGNFYEVLKPVQDFGGRHRIVFTDQSGRKRTEDFNFQPFSLAEEFPEQLKKAPFAFVLQPFPEPATVRLVITDTSFASPDVNEEVRVETDGRISVNAALLANLTAGPVTLEVFREEEKPLKNAGKKGGRLLLTYGLRRQFELVR